jgi:hypothetical protein
MISADSNKLISALCYFSVFFAGFILPIAVYFIVDDKEVKRHAKHAFVSHLIPLISIPLFVLGGIMSGMGDVFGIVIVLGFILTFLVNVVVVVWNVVKGIQVLKSY